MDDTTVIIVVAMFAVVVVVISFMFRKQIKAVLRIPGWLRLDLEGSNEPAQPPAGAEITDAKSRAGQVEACAEGGRAKIERAEAEGDIRAVSTSPGEETPPKKA